MRAHAAFLERFLAIALQHEVGVTDRFRNPTSAVRHCPRERVFMPEAVLYTPHATNSVADCTLARSAIRDPLSEGFRHFVASMPAPVASGWSESPGGTCTHWKAPPCHSQSSYFILRNINLLRHNIQILANMVSRSARRRPLCVAARRALIFEGWVRGPEFTHADHAVDIDNGIPRGV